MTLERWSVWVANLDPVVGSEQQDASRARLERYQAKSYSARR
ncbi:MAG: hypothetical protein QOF72_2797 [Blastocatellia bacterium]|jgi:mRNA-degrading endonuclease toxin of MazEF toxin-antitoxin module|nr:hypothetical protein [Blastocatellia bacterium]